MYTNIFILYTVVYMFIHFQRH